VVNRDCRGEEKKINTTSEERWIIKEIRRGTGEIRDKVRWSEGSQGVVGGERASNRFLLEKKKEIRVVQRLIKKKGNSRVPRDRLHNKILSTVRQPGGWGEKKLSNGSRHSEGRGTRKSDANSRRGGSPKACFLGGAGIQATTGNILAQLAVN